jgi:hypothetical protein
MFDCPAPPMAISSQELPGISRMLFNDVWSAPC